MCLDVTEGMAGEFPCQKFEFNFTRTINWCYRLKVKYYELSNSMLLLFKSLLMGRTQYVEYRGFASSEYLVGSGVVQVSNLHESLIIYYTL